MNVSSKLVRHSTLRECPLKCSKLKFVIHSGIPFVFELLGKCLPDDDVEIKFIKLRALVSDAFMESSLYL